MCSRWDGTFVDDLDDENADIVVSLFEVWISEGRRSFDHTLEEMNGANSYITVELHMTLLDRLFDCIVFHCTVHVYWDFYDSLV